MAGNNGNGNGHTGKFWLVRGLEGKLEPRTGGDSPGAETALEFAETRQILSWEDAKNLSPKQQNGLYVVCVIGTLSDVLNGVH